MRRGLEFEVQQLRLKWNLHGKNQQASRKLTQNRRPPSRIRAESTGQESKIAEIREEA